MHMRILLTLTISAALVVLATSSIAQAQASEARPELEPAPPDSPAAQAPAYTPPTEAPPQPVDPALQPDQPPPPKGPFGGYGMLLMMGGVFVLMYLFMGRSRRKRESKRREMLGMLAPRPLTVHGGRASLGLVAAIYAASGSPDAFTHTRE